MAKAALYLDVRSMVDVIEDIPVDATCAVCITCTAAPVGISTGDYNESNRFHAVVVLDDGYPDSGYVYCCEDCGTWLADVFGVELPAVRY